MSLSGCGDFARTNPFDPATPVVLTITGPDSSFAQFDTLRFSVTTNPKYENEFPIWKATAGLELLDYQGGFRVPSSGALDATGRRVTVTVTIDGRSATKSVEVTFRPAIVRICQVGSRQTPVFSLQSAIGLCANVFDARGGAARGTVSWRSLDPEIVSVDASRNQAFSRAYGTARIVATHGTASDTMTVLVQRQARSITLYPAACSSAAGLSMSVGSTLQLTIGSPMFDAEGVLITDSATIQRTVAEVNWYRSFFSNAVSVSSTGLVTALSPGTSVVTGATTAAGSQCKIQVQ